MATIATLNVVMKARTADFLKKVQRARRAVDRFHEAASKKLAGGLRFLGFAAAGAAVGVGAMVRHQAQAVDETRKFARVLGLSQAQLEGLKIASARSGIETDQLKTSIRTMLSTVANANSATSPAVRALGEMGLSLGEIRRLPVAERVERIASAISQMKSQTDKQNATLALFGTRNLQTLLALEELADKGLNHFAAEAVSFGLVVSEEVGGRMEELNDRIADVGLRLTGFARQITARALPFLETAVTHINNFLASLSTPAGTRTVLHSILDVARELNVVLTTTINTFRALRGAAGFVQGAAGIGGLALAAGGRLARAVGLADKGNFAEEFGKNLFAEGFSQAGRSFDVAGRGVEGLLGVQDPRTHRELQGLRGDIRSGVPATVSP